MTPDYPCFVAGTGPSSDGSYQFIRRYRDGREIRQFCPDITAALYAIHDNACIELNWPEGQC